jgi:hypothetical protein
MTRYKELVLAAFAIGLMAVSGCASVGGNASTATRAPSAAGSAQATGSGPLVNSVPLTAVPGVTATGSGPTATGTVTIEQICAAFAQSSPSVDSTQCTKAARSVITGGNADGNQCVVDLQVAAERAKNNDFSQMQAQEACRVADDPAGNGTVPGSDKIPLNADHKTLRS